MENEYGRMMLARIEGVSDMVSEVLSGLVLSTPNPRAALTAMLEEAKTKCRAAEDAIGDSRALAMEATGVRRGIIERALAKLPR